jgi:hypothetical protein
MTTWDKIEKLYQLIYRGRARAETEYEFHMSQLTMEHLQQELLGGFYRAGRQYKNPPSYKGVPIKVNPHLGYDQIYLVAVGE